MANISDFYEHLSDCSVFEIDEGSQHFADPYGLALSVACAASPAAAPFDDPVSLQPIVSPPRLGDYDFFTHGTPVYCEQAKPESPVYSSESNESLETPSPQNRYRRKRPGPCYKRTTYLKERFDEWCERRSDDAGAEELRSLRSTRRALSEQFPRMEKAFASVQGERKAFPYNTVLHHALELNLQPGLARDFPLASTTRALKRNEKVWWNMCAKLQWPYISEHAAMISRLRKRSKL